MRLIKLNNYIFLLGISFVVFSDSYSSDKEKMIIYEGSSVFENPHPHFKAWKNATQWQVLNDNTDQERKKTQNFLFKDSDIVNVTLNKYASTYREELQKIYYHQ